MKNSKYIFNPIQKSIWIWIILILTYSCDTIESVDDIAPFYNLTEDNTFSNAAKTEAVLSGVYTGWKASFIGIYTSRMHLLSGDFISLTTGNDLYINQVDYTTNHINQYYREYYELIQRANYLIKALQSDQVILGLSDARRTEMEGEARLHRAMAHFFLLRSFGQFYDLNSDLGIVTSTEPISGSKDDPRSTVQESYDVILSDLDFAMTNAPTVAALPYGLLTSHTAKAVKAKVLLYMGDWPGAASLALETINSGVYELKPDFRDIYTEGYKSAENIFSPIVTFPNFIQVTGAGFPAGPPLIAAADKSVGTPTDGDIVTGDGFDPRFAYTFAADGLPNGILSNKYPFVRISGQQTSHFILRLGEMYLIYAEAKARAASGVDADGLAKLNAIRFRTGLPDVNPATKAELLEAILLEKQLELLAEFNEPWYDMVRYHIFGDINISDLKSTITSNNQLILPIPSLALSGNGGLVQNPGY